MLDLRFYDRTIIHEDEERMIPLGVKMMHLKSSNGIKFPQFCSDRRWMKAAERRDIRKEGRKRRRSEVDEGMMETQGLHEHTGLPTGRNSFKIQLRFTLFVFSFIE